uniref:NADH-ubiquinone oxidoreductase chain 1 n=1 Tax=Gordius sp. VVA-2019 TaxID=2586752 RepID=A0A514ABU1_9BILA|nr:NADH dehydrogenase subunit 1 [Gordius sp. VVA-2019]
MVLFEFVLSQASLLVSMSFFTLLERKMLGSVQIRKGPNKVLMMGLGQPFMDAIKLFTKGAFKYTTAWWHPWMVAPALSLVLYLVLFEFVLSQASFAQEVEYSIVAFLGMMGLGVYVLILSGWTSNSKYSVLGAMRAVAQAVSYELALSFIILVMAMVILSFVISDFMTGVYPLMYLYMFMFLSFLICSLAETNRTPYDLMEGESELVSGFNTEYYSGYFAVIFMAEYLAIMMFSVFMATLWCSADIFFGSVSMTFLQHLLMGGVVSMLFLLFRSSYPRVRYDLLLLFVWGALLPFVMLTSLLCMSYLYYG